MKRKSKFILNIILLQFIFAFIIMIVIDNGIVGFAAAQESTPNDTLNVAFLALSSAIAISGSTMAAGMSIKTVGTAAISSLVENEGTFFKAFLVIALGEALAIYGLIVAILLWIKIP